MSDANIQPIFKNASFFYSYFVVLHFFDFYVVDYQQLVVSYFRFVVFVVFERGQKLHVLIFMQLIINEIGIK